MNLSLPSHPFPHLREVPASWRVRHSAWHLTPPTHNCGWGTARSVGVASLITELPWKPPAQGSVYNFSFDSVSGKLQRLKRSVGRTNSQCVCRVFPTRLVVAPGQMVTCISYRTWVNREARDPSLLVSCTDDTLRLFRLYILPPSLPAPSWPHLSLSPADCCLIVVCTSRESSQCPTTPSLYSVPSALS